MQKSKRAGLGLSGEIRLSAADLIYKSAKRPRGSERKGRQKEGMNGRTAAIRASEAARLIYGMEGRKEGRSIAVFGLRKVPPRAAMPVFAYCG